MPKATDRPLLLDTHTALWLADGAPIDDEAEAALERAGAGGVGVYLSPISAWEIGMLVSRGRISLSRPPSDWIEVLLTSGVRQAELSPAILIASSFLPGNLHRDPADRILAATARACGFALVTRDEKLLTYAAAGHMHAISC